LQGKIFFTIYAVALAAIMGVLLFVNGSMVESLSIIDCTFNDRFNFIIVQFKNDGNTVLAIEEVCVDFKPVLHIPSDTAEPIWIGETVGLYVEYDWSSFRPYTITLVTKGGKVFSKSATAPLKQPALDVENVTWNSADTTVNITVRNVGTEERKILGLGVTDYPDSVHPYRESRSSTNINRGKIVPVDQTFTIALNWTLCAYDSELSVNGSWISGKKYDFCICPETGPLTYFDSRAP